MDNLLRKLVSPFSHLETSYLPVMTWLTKWSIRSFSIPITSEPGSKEFSVIKKIRHWVIYVCTALLWFFYNVTYSFWFYKNIYNSHGSLPIWQKVIAFYFLISYDMIFVLHICLLFRKRELPQVLKTCVWMEAKCISRGASDYTKINILSNLDAAKFSLFVIPVMLGALGSFRPCTPPSILNEVLLECRDGWGDQDAEMWLRVVNGAAQWYVWFSLPSVMIATISRVFLYPSVMVELWIKMIERQLDQYKFGIHGLSGFRVAQVFQNLVNSVMRKPLITIFVLLTMLSEITSLYVIITSWENISFGVSAFFYLMVIDYFVIIHITLHSLSKPYVVSVKLAKNMKSLRSQNAWFKKFLTSCPPLKVGMGDAFTGMNASHRKLLEIIPFPSC
ncbi:hypothetical protein Fcan01_11561 [Folsomia candida]|uniref:Gustatory receptor n=1 Tax=Folsomia candida TaxID=158441 RepID=A0A226EAL7_FOLCA|nr:hypothetical protein Fcan01_11561 [Folsomia candida]